MLLSSIVHGAAIRRPAYPALVCDGNRWTFWELSDRVSKLAAGLSMLTEPGERVAILADNCVEYIDCLYGVSQAGNTLAPINQRLAVPEIEYVLSDAEPAVLIVGSEYYERLGEIRSVVPSIRHVVVIGDVIGDAPPGALSYRSLLSSTVLDPSRAHSDDNEVAWLVYTSGTTGRPKGAMLTHRNIISAMLNAMIEWKPDRDDRQLFCFPLCHVAAFIPLMYHLRQATVVLMPSFDPAVFLRLVEEYEITHTGLAPTMLNFLLQHPDINSARLDSVELVVYGSAPMSPTLLENGIKRFGEVFVQTYGMTELSGNVLVLGLDHHHRAITGEPELLAAAGQMECLATVRLVDDDMKDVAVGDVGEIVVSGDQVMKGYWRAEEATAEVLVDGWLRTGDLARMDEEGLVYVVDRKKDMIITGGENVYPREVEDVIARLPGLSEVAVIGLPDDRWGEAVTAVVVPRAGQTVKAEDVRAACRDSLAGFKVPKRVEFTDELPRNAAGKVVKTLLRDRFLEPGNA
ncbi:long-chain fatty acid--CoA ligase [Mycolicibacterium pulveris]|uniref:Long-chain-fatty-acid--CoA ligase FadD13 n=1 Tax=Mycolicibacterium pulveris TaxID=36813 RepID=A0A7I7UNR1_MYCPV|nr:long-chain fatty acid--CoA ligase [Mycolicibacterium pulveris]MCV6983204.1 long-chain fatty acid--CoA ligase [Mycolicibacterium pulveris]BBY83075.1 AMP-dependent synthetase [Mycolicibacterium pulveris]